MRTLKLACVVSLVVLPAFAAAAQTADGAGPMSGLGPETTGALSSEFDNSRLVKAEDPALTSPDFDGPLDVSGEEQADDPAERHLRAAKSLNLRFQGYRSISGVYKVAQNGTISIPVLGRVPVTDISIGGLENKLARRMAKFTGKTASVTVEIEEYRPVFVTGSVERPGSFQWQPRLSVLQAVTISGGARQRELGSTVGSVFEVRSQVKRATSELKTLWAQLARLRAEYAGEKKIEVPERLIGLVGPSEAHDLIASQQELMDSRTKALEARRKTLEEGIELGKVELNGLREQQKQIAKQKNAIEEQVDRVERMIKRKLTTMDRLLDVQSELSRLFERESAATVAIAAVNGRMSRMRNELVQLNEVRMAELNNEIVETQRLAFSHEVAIDTARRMEREFSEAQTALRERSEDNDAVVRYQVVRRVGDETKTLDVDAFELLEPEDLLIVTRGDASRS